MQHGKFKQIEDGIQADCIVDDGFIHDFYLCNDPVDKNSIADGFCPMHCYILHIFGNLTDSGHRCKMGIHLNSVNHACVAYNLENKVPIKDVIWKHGHGVPPLVFQD